MIWCIMLTQSILNSLPGKKHGINNNHLVVLKHVYHKGKQDGGPGPSP